ncbi:MAG: zinc ABC transporter substrate-binding protein [Chlamydiales bacterium]
MKHLFPKIKALCVVIALLTSCSNSQEVKELRQWMTPNDKIKILATTGMIEDVVAAVGGEFVDTHTLIRGDLDPHSYQLVKGDDEKLAFADLIFYNGLGLEHGPSLRHYLKDSEKAIPLGNQIQKENPNLILMVEGTTDPHIWMDVSLWKKTLPYIVEALSKIDPEHAEQYQLNARKYAELMQHKHGEILSIMRSIPEEHRYLVSSHDAFNYFSRAYLAAEGRDDWEDRFAAPEGLAPESQLSTLDIQNIINHIEKYQICVLFPESNVSKDSIRKIVNAGRERGLKLRVATDVLYADAMGPPGSDGDTYLKMVYHNASVLAKSLREPICE